MSLNFIDEGKIKQAIAEVRSDSHPNDWVLVSYDSPKSTNIILVGSGVGGSAELAQHLDPALVGFGLVRKVDRIDDSETVKFAYIVYIGDKVPILQKGKISIHAGVVKEFLGPFHVKIDASSLDEISDEAILNRIQDNSGTRTRVLTEEGTRAQSSASGAPKPKPKVGSVPKSDTVQFANEQELKAEIKEFRGESSTNWLLFGYEGGDNVITLLGKGEGGVTELVEQLDDKLVGYALVKETEKIDDSLTVKFVYINWVGENIPRMLRARLGTHSGSIQEFLAPYHVDIHATVKSEVNEDIVRDTIKRAAGTANRVLSSAPAPSGSGGSGGGAYRSGVSFAGKASGKAPSAPASSGNVTIQDVAEIKAALQDVRKDGTETDWALVGYDGPNSNNLILLGKGTGGIDALSDQLNSEIVGYGLVRTTEKIDDSVTVKFIWIDWAGDNINRMLRARLGTHSGTVKELFAPYHVDLHTSEKNEVTEEHIRKIIKKAAGTAFYVRDDK